MMPIGNPEHLPLALALNSTPARLMQHTSALQLFSRQSPYRTIIQLPTHVYCIHPTATASWHTYPTATLPWSGSHTPLTYLRSSSSASDTAMASRS